MRRAYIFLVYAICGIALMGTKPMAQMQQTELVASAPIPAMITIAKALFIANGGVEDFPEDGNMFSGLPDRPYNQFYAAMKKVGKFRLVTNPSDADLVIEIRVTSKNISDGNTTRMDSQLHAILIDPKTHITMWALETRIVPAMRQSTRDQNFDKAMDYIVAQVKGLTGKP